MEHVSIVLVNYNSDTDTKECLRSLQDIKHPNFSYSILVVDNGSMKPLQLPKTLLKKNVELIRSEANLGFTGGNNLGIQHALDDEKTDYVLLLNNDTTVHPNFLKEMVACIQTEVNIGAVGAKIYFSKKREFHYDSYRPKDLGNVLWFAGGSIDWQHLAAFHRGVDEVDRGHFDQQTDTDFITGCAMLLPRTVLERVGMLDDRYFVYLEDVDLSLRIREAGYVLKVCPKAEIWHKNAGSSGGAGSVIHQYYQTRNRIYFGWRYLSGRMKLVVVRIAWQLLLRGDSIHRKAIWDACTGAMGKQPVI